VLECESNTPLYKRLADSMRAAIDAGQMLPGNRLPSARQLAMQYQVSASTALRALDDLVSCGYARAIAKKEFVVSADLCRPITIAGALETEPAVETLSPPVGIYARRILEHSAHTVELAEAGVQTPDAKLIPTSHWQRLITKHCQIFADRNFLYNYSGHPFGLYDLRLAISQYLKRARGVTCSPDQVVITSGNRLDFFSRLILSPGDTVVMEDPSVPIARRILLGHGAKLEFMPVDKGGAQVESLRYLAHRPRFVYVTPSHQDPTGTLMDQERRLELLNWAVSNNVLIWENDFDYHFRHYSRPLPAVAALGPNQCVFYSGSFWLALGPLTSLAYIVLPSSYVKHAELVCGASMLRESMVLEQSALAEFISSGSLEKHLHKMRQLLMPKRQMMIQELTQGLPGQIDIGNGTGTHLVIRFRSDNKWTEEAILDCSRESGLNLQSTKPYYAGPHPSREFLIPFNYAGDRQVTAIASFVALLMK
jgi:GntR family transcriptional regulator/MocR family aminotransferase